MHTRSPVAPPSMPPLVGSAQIWDGLAVQHVATVPENSMGRHEEIEVVPVNDNRKTDGGPTKAGTSRAQCPVTLGTSDAVREEEIMARVFPDSGD